MRVGVYLGGVLNKSAGGGATFQQSIFNALLKLDSKHEFYIFTDNDLNIEDNDNIKTVKLERYYSNDNESFFKRNLFRLPRKLKRIKLKKEYKTVLNRSVIEHKIELVWFATPAYEFVEVPYIYTVWDLQHRLQSFFPEVSVAGWKFEDREKRYNSIIPRAAYVIIGNEAGKQEVVKFYKMPEDRIKTIPLPVPDFVLDQKLLQQKSSIKLPSLYLFYPSQFWPHKNHIVILLALKILQEKYNLNFKVIFTGSDKGNLKYIKEKIAELKLEEQVNFLGFVSYEDLIKIYKNAFALVFPSFFGPDNIPPLEAFALECPVIAANVSGAEYQLKDTALLFNPKDENELVCVIKKLYDDVDLKNKLIQKGKEKVKDYSLENYLKSVVGIIDEFEPIRRCWSSKDKYVHL